jgi:outer membrane protein TolC
MLKKTIILAAAIPFYCHAVSITTLLDSLQKRPEYQLDQLSVEKSSLEVQAVHDKMLPTVNLYGGMEIYSSPNGLLPVPPNNMIKMVQDQSIGQPFSKQILREGVNFTWPLFVKSIYTLEDKASLLHLAAREKQKLNFIQREAVIVGSVAQLRYLESLKTALLSKKRSIEQTLVSTRLKVKEGRTPESAMFLLNGHINDLDIAMNTIDQNINLLTSKIETLTGIHLSHSLPLQASRHIKKGEFFALKPLQKRVEASRKGVQAAGEAYIPSVVTKGNYTLSQADAYNNDKSLHEHFGMAGLYVTMPLFDASKGTASQRAEVAYIQEKSTLEQTAHTLKVQAGQLEREMELLEKSVSLAHKSVSQQNKLLKIAKVKLANGTITQEEYLRYEDALAEAKAGLYKAEAQLWQDRAQLAVIYGNDLRRIVK